MNEGQNAKEQNLKEIETSEFSERIIKGFRLDHKGVDLLTLL